MTAKTAIDFASAALSNLSRTLHDKRWQELDHAWSEWEIAEQNIREALGSGSPGPEELDSLRLMEQQCRRLMRSLRIRMHNLREDIASLDAVQARLYSANRLVAGP